MTNTLKCGDYIAFGFNYNGGEPDEIIVSNITYIAENGLLCHFLYGHHSLSEIVKIDDVLAIGNNKEGKVKLRGYSGKFTVVKRNELLNKNIEKED